MAEPVLLIDKALHKIKHVFRVSGINITFKKTRMDKYRCWFTYFVNLTWVNYDLVGSALWLLYGIRQNSKFTDLTFSAPCTIFASLVHSKTLSLVFNEKKVDLIIANIRQLETQQKERNGDPETEKIIKAEDDYLNKVIKALNVVYLALIISFALNPMLLTLLHYYKTNEVQLILPFLIVYPFDPYDLRYFPFVYLHEVWSGQFH